MIMFPIYVKKRVQKEVPWRESSHYAFKSKEIYNESCFNVPIWLLSVTMDESKQNFR